MICRAREKGEDLALVVAAATVIVTFVVAQTVLGP